jgi:simple sugar transport system ATP-binding protein
MMSIPAVELRDIDKRFGAVQANRRASLSVLPGEIHALVGENGAGKSTLMRILAGFTPPDAGEILLGGAPVGAWGTRQAIARGLSMVHQHFMLVGTLTVAENVILGREPRRGISVDLRGAAAEIAALSERYGLRVDPMRLVSDLSVGEAQRVEIVKTLYRGARVLILDEPTAVLTPAEVRELWTVLRTLREGGTTLIVITHKLDEVLDLSDRITVMRGGQTVARFETRATNAVEIARAMVGRDVSLAPPERGAREALGKVVLHVEGLLPVATRELHAAGVSFQVRAGEILGIAGVEGNGQTELVEALTGLRRIRHGQLWLGTHDITRLSARERAHLGLAHIPEDRRRRGLVLDFSVAENLILGRQQEFSRYGLMNRAAILEHARAQIRAYDVRPAYPSLPVGALSGGNQQKVVIARELSRDYSALVASQPTRGVDVGAIELIHRHLLAVRAAGKAILLLSAELSEILALSDRIAVLFRGEIVATLARAEADEERIGRFMTGLREGVRQSA